jgi:hypothetical protein
LLCLAAALAYEVVLRGKSYNHDDAYAAGGDGNFRRLDRPVMRDRWRCNATNNDIIMIMSLSIILSRSDLRAKICSASHMALPWPPVT